MCKIRFILLAVVVLVQVLYLCGSYAARVQELQHAPRVRLAVEPYDPRAFLRGDCWELAHVADLDFPDDARVGESMKREMSAAAAARNSDGEATPVALLLHLRVDWVGFFAMGEDGVHRLTRVERRGSAEDCCRSGEFCLPVFLRDNFHGTYDSCERMVVADSCCVVLKNPLRYYMTENTVLSSYHFYSAVSRVPKVLEAALRPDGTLMPLQYYIGDMTIEEAAALFNAGKLKQKLK